MQVVGKKIDRSSEFVRQGVPVIKVIDDLKEKGDRRDGSGAGRHRNRERADPGRTSRTIRQAARIERAGLAMRKTLKYEAALDCAAELLDRAELNRARKDNQSLYDVLERRGYFWDQPEGKWQQFKPSTSMFQADDGGATGVFRLRVMCDPRDLDRLLEIVNEALDTYGATITEQSNVYPNRRGPGCRVYLTGRLPETKEREE